VNFHGIGNNKNIDRDLDSIKLKIPNFQGKSDLEAYSEWKKKVDWIFFFVVAIWMRGRCNWQSLVIEFIDCTLI
jgi:hypothetical protein